MCLVPGTVKITRYLVPGTPWHEVHNTGRTRYLSPIDNQETLRFLAAVLYSALFEWSFVEGTIRIGERFEQRRLWMVSTLWKLMMLPGRLSTINFINGLSITTHVSCQTLDGVGKADLVNNACVSPIFGNLSNRWENENCSGVRMCTGR